MIAFYLILYWPSLLGVILSAAAYWQDCPWWGAACTLAIGVILNFLWTRLLDKNVHII